MSDLVFFQKSISDFFVGGHSNAGVNGVPVQGRKHSSPEHEETLNERKENYYGSANVFVVLDIVKIRGSSGGLLDSILPFYSVVPSSIRL